jgi:predicted O-methyltransferase YrrM
MIPDNSLDFIFIDGDHTTDAVLQDIRDYYPKLKDTGIMLGHDYSWDTVRLAVVAIFGAKLQSHANMWYIPKKDIDTTNLFLKKKY